MNWDQIEGKWNEVKGQLKQKFSKLNDDDFLAIAGKRDELLGRLQRKYGYTKDRAHRELDEFLGGLGEERDLNRKAS